MALERSINSFTELNEVIENFIQDPTIRRNRWHQKTLIEIGHLLERDIANGKIEGREQYARFFEDYCAILFQIEKWGRAEWLNIPLAEISSQNEETVAYGVQLRNRAAQVTQTGDLELSIKTVTPEDRSISTDTTLYRNGIAASWRETADTIFNSIPETGPQKTCLERLVVFSLSQAVEIECHSLLQPAIQNFWPRRVESILSVVDKSDRKFDLKPAARRSLERWALDYRELLVEGRFPLHTILVSLRYLLNLSTRDKLQATLPEFANLLLFFGHNTEYEGHRFRNVLGMRGPGAAQIAECYFRMLRLHKLKKKAMGAAPQFDSAYVAIAIEDAKKILKCLATCGYSIDMQWTGTR